jgi:NitT/TauT family transport system ATP-binding protein
VVQEIRFEPQFVDLYHQIWEALRAEVDIAYSQITTVAAEASR